MHTYQIQMKKTGSALIYGLIIITITSFVLLSLMQFVVSNIRLGFHAEPKEQSFHIAEAGVYFYRWHLAHNVEGRTATQIQDFWTNDPLGVDDNQDGDCDDPDTSDGDGNGLESYVALYEDGSEDGSGYYEICVTKPPEYSSVVEIKATGWTTKNPSLTRTVKARLRRPSWSENAVLANQFTRLSSDTIIYGPLHGNEGFRLDGVAHNRISSSVATYYDSDSGVNANRPGVWAGDSSSNVIVDDSANFLAGKAFPVPAIDFDSAAADFNVLKDEATSLGLSFDSSQDGRYIELGEPSASQMRISRVTNYSSNTLENLSTDSAAVYTIPDEGVIYVEDNVWIDGILPAGKLLTVAAHNQSSSISPSIILGTDDLRYENYDENTVLGLMAEEDIKLVRDNDNLYIDGALMAQNGFIGWKKENSSWDGRTNNKITINGALASNERMGFGYTNGDGYTNRELIFDNNLIFQPPPLFPSGESYAIDQWSEIEE